MRTHWGELKGKHSLPKYRIKVSVPDEAVTKRRWEDKICLCWRLEGRRLLPKREHCSGDWAPLQRTSLSLFDKWPFRHLSECVQEASLVCSTYEDIATSWSKDLCTSGRPSIAEKSQLEKLRGVKVTCFHQSILSQILHAWTAEHSRYELQLSTNIHF